MTMFAVLGAVDSSCLTKDSFFLTALPPCPKRLGRDASPPEVQLPHPDALTSVEMLGAMTHIVNLTLLRRHTDYHNLLAHDRGARTHNKSPAI